MKRYIRFTSELDELKAQALDKIEVQYSSLSIQAKDEDWVGQVLDIFHEAVDKNPKDFVQKVFFEFHHTVLKTREQQDRIYKLIAGLSSLSRHDIQVQLVNIYRAIVSEVFDPYISVIVACLQFKEDSFDSFIIANLSQGERNKVEFSKSRLRSTNIFAGYNPIVRNATSHLGSEGIIYEEHAIVFRNIGRGNMPRVDVIKWTNKEIFNNILSLMDLVHAIDVAVNIFGVDISWTIDWDKELHRSFLSEIFGKQQRLELQETFDEIVMKIINSSISDEKKTEAVSNLFFLELGRRELPCKGVRLNSVANAILIVVPEIASDLSDEKEFIKHALELLRYGIVAESCFRYIADKFYIGDFNQEGKSTLKVFVKKEDLRLYGKEEAGLYDLMVDSEIFLHGRKVEVNVDFEKLKELEYANLKRNFPRKNRG